MEEQIIPLRLAKIPLRLKLSHGLDKRLYEGFIDPDAAEGTPAVWVSQADLEARRDLYPAGMSDMLLEYNELPGRVSEYLLEHDCCLFHGAAFLWREKAYIFTAPSGTGKSTQYVLWKEQLGEEMQILNGDKPILRLEADGRLWVYPSPWQGKENMGSMRCAPLGGVIVLQQGVVNSVRRLRPVEAVAPLYLQFLFPGETEETVRRVCALESCLIDQVPVWHMVNRGDVDSAKLCINTMLQFEEDRK